MIRRPLVLALAFALLPAVAGAEDLMQTYELARAGDPQLSAAESTRNAVREGEVQARANLLPQINGEASFNKSETESEGGASVNPDGSISIGRSESDSSSRDFRINLRQMVYDRSNFTRLDSEQALSRASDFSLEAAGDSLITRTSLAYFNVLIAIETLAAAEAQEEALKKQFDFADKRLEVGLAPITDVHEARAQYDNARANTIVTRNALEDAYQALAEITGETIRNLKGLPDDFRPALPNEQDAEAWVATAISNNPNLQALQEQVVSAEADVGTARAGHWPSLYFNGNYSEQAFWGDRTNLLNNSSIPIGSETRGPNFGVVLSVPIFSGGATQSRVRQALANRDVRADQLEQQKRAVVRIHAQRLPGPVGRDQRSRGATPGVGVRQQRL